MKLLVATEMTGGRFHRIRSAAAAKCPERPKLPDFYTAWARSRHHQDQEEAEATKLVAELDRDGPRHPTGPGPSCDITATQVEHGTRDFAALATINF
jgi:hypothetical protein